MVPLKIAREDKSKIISRIKNYFDAERGETIGDLAAEQLLDFVAAEIEPHIYNIALFDARQILNERFAQLEDDLYILERPTEKR